MDEVLEMPAPGATKPIAYMRSHEAPKLPAPDFSTGPMAWAKANLFSDWKSALLTLVAGSIAVWTIFSLISLFFLRAIWSAPDGALCRPPDSGVCWPFIVQKLPYFIYGSYPLDQRWRVDATMIIGAVLILWLLWDRLPGKRIAAGLFFVVFPVAMFILLSGYNTFPVNIGFYLPSGIHFDGIRPWRFFGLDALTFPWGVAFHFDFLKLGEWAFTMPGTELIGLPKVDTNDWGGIFVSLMLSLVGIVFSLPLGVLLALGRRSNLPIVKLFSVVYIEFLRGVPFITVLFMAVHMLPLFVPASYQPDKMLLPLIGTVMFASAYMAEIVRGGLQAMPKGQFEGAMAMGLGYWQMMRLIVLPQALTIVIPGIVNTFIGLFKDTTLVSIVGIFDFLNTVIVGVKDLAWAGPKLLITAYAFAALFYWCFCYSMASYSKFIEHKLSASRNR